MPLSQHVRKNALVWLLAIALLFVGTLYGVQTWRLRTGSQSTPATAPIDLASIVRGFVAFSGKGGQTEIDAHRRLVSDLRRYHGSKATANPDDVRAAVSAVTFQNDDRHFGTEVIPSFFRRPLPLTPDPRILAVLRTGSIPQLVANTDAEDTSTWLNRVSASVDGAWFVSVSYSTPSGLPSGLSLQDGKIINAAIQRFDGLLQIDPKRGIELGHINELYLDGRRLRIRDSFEDYDAFLRHAERTGTSVAQGLLLLNHGELLVDASEQARAPRRLLLVRSTGETAIYASLLPQTLYEAADVARNQFGARQAFNLDSGDYATLAQKAGGQLAIHSSPKAGNRAANVLIFPY